MLDQIPASHQDLLKDETRAFAFVATTMADGSPQVTPVWFNHDGEHILINSAEGRVKDENMRQRPRVAVTVMDLKKPYHYMQLRGEVIEATTEGGAEHIHELSRKYRGENYTIPAGQTRTKYTIRVDQVSTM
jgi:PPOX class probable F420-dependent enzyme